jgi:hypothetical protein
LNLSFDEAETACFLQSYVFYLLQLCL